MSATRLPSMDRARFEVAFAPEHDSVRSTVTRLCDKLISPLVEEAERSATFPVELFPALGAAGYLCARIPADRGGPDMDKISECIISEEMMYVNRGIGTSVFAHSHLGTFPISAFGTPEQRDRFLAPAIKGDRISAFALTEPEAGSDVQSIRTTARKCDGGWRLKGSKMYTTNGTIADFVIVAAYVDHAKGYDGIGLFIVEAGSEGMTRVKLDKEGSRSSDTAQLFFEDTFVPDDCVLTTEGGFRLLMKTLDEGRVTVAAGAVGLARRAFEAALDYAATREAFGQPIGRFQVIGHQLATLATEIDAARLMVYRAATLVDRGAPFSAEASMAKVYATEVAVRTAIAARHIYGGAGELPDALVGRFLRDAQNLTVGEGTSEIQRNIIAKGLGL